MLHGMFVRPLPDRHCSQSTSSVAQLRLVEFECLQHFPRFGRRCGGSTSGQLFIRGYEMQASHERAKASAAAWIH